MYLPTKQTEVPVKIFIYFFHKLYFASQFPFVCPAQKRERKKAGRREVFGFSATEGVGGFRAAEEWAMQLTLLNFKCFSNSPFTV